MQESRAKWLNFDKFLNNEQVCMGIRRSSLRPVFARRRPPSRGYDDIVVVEVESEGDIREVFGHEYLEKLATNMAEFWKRRCFVIIPARVMTVMDKTK